MPFAVIETVPFTAICRLNNTPFVSYLIVKNLIKSVFSGRWDG